MRLELRRPLAFIDLESTGTRPEHDRIVEIAVLKLHPDGREEFRCKRVNPGLPIPADATVVHGITDADVASEPRFVQYANGVSGFLEDCDFAGFGDHSLRPATATRRVVAGEAHRLPLAGACCDRRSAHLP